MEFRFLTERSCDDELGQLGKRGLGLDCACLEQFFEMMGKRQETGDAWDGPRARSQSGSIVDVGSAR